MTGTFSVAPRLMRKQEVSLFHSLDCTLIMKLTLIRLDWYQHKLAHPWFLPSINRFLSPMDNESWDLTPHHTNLVETAHAARNAETSVGVPVLTAILEYA